MLTLEELKTFMDEDAASVKKRFAREGERYYDGDHDIRGYRLFYYDADGDLVEDKTRANFKIPHPFFKELVDQGTQYILSSSDPFVLSDDPDLQKELDDRFNYNDDFIAELTELITDAQSRGFGYMYAMKGADNRLRFMRADSIGVIEVESRFAGDHQPHIIYWYIDRVDKEGHRIKKIQDWDDQQTYYYEQNEDGEIKVDSFEQINPRPHILYQEEGDSRTFYDGLGFIPFFRLDNNKKQFSNLKPIKSLIDDYDLMASSLSNNLQEFDHPIHVVKGFQGDNLTELQQNLKTKKIIGVSPDGGLETYTVDIPVEGRKTKLDLDEKNIYRFGMGLNLSALKDTTATTNIAIKAAYSLLDLRCKRLEVNIKRFLRKIVEAVIDEINHDNGTDYQTDTVYFEFTHEVMSNEKENAEIDLVEAQTKQTIINVLLSLANTVDDETIIRGICECLDLDFNEIMEKRPADEAAGVEDAIREANGIIPDEMAGGV